MRYLFLDTNVLLHFNDFDTIPWNSIVGPGDYKVVITLLVIDELDKQKSSSKKKISKKAKRIISKIEAICDSLDHSDIVIGNSRPSEKTFTEYSLSKAHQDDCLLATIIEYECGVDDEKVFITNDSGAKIRAQGASIKCLKMPEQYSVEPDVDEDEKKIRALQSELNEYKSRSPKVSLSFSGNEFLIVAQPVMAISRVEYIQTESQKNRIRYPYMKVDDSSDSGFRALVLLNAPTPNQVKTYNDDLDQYYDNYDRYLNEKYDYEIYKLRCIELIFTLSNTGTIPAEDIDINMHFPDGFLLVKELNDPPKPPKAPSKPEKFPSFNIGEVLHSINIDRSIDRMHDDFDSPKITKTNSYDVVYNEERLKHNTETILPKLYACFDTIESMSSFTIDYSLVIANVIKKQIGKLNVKIER